MELEIVNNEKNTETNLVKVSQRLRKFLTMKMMMKEKATDDIFEQDIADMLESFKKKNEVRTNVIKLPAEIAIEFINIIKEKVVAENQDLGVIEIDISKKDFSVEEFVANAKGIRYKLRLKILSIEDLRKEELKFLNDRYGITYLYTDNEYHIDELLDTVNNMKTLIKQNERKIVSKKKDLSRACAIADIVFNNFKLVVPAMYEHPQKEVVFSNGEKMKLPNIRIIQNTSEYENIKNIFEYYKADLSGMRKVYRECLRNDGFEMIERIESKIGTVGTEFKLENSEYGILVEEEGIRILEMKKNCT